LRIEDERRKKERKKWDEGVDYFGSQISSTLLYNNSGFFKISPFTTSKALAKKSK